MPSDHPIRLAYGVTLAQRFKFYRERNAAPLAYFFARMYHVATLCDRNSHPQAYRIPSFLVTWNCTGHDHGRGVGFGQA